MSEADERTEEGTSESRNYSVTEIISNQANTGWLKVNRYGRIVRRKAISGINTKTCFLLTKKCFRAQ